MKFRTSIAIIKQAFTLVELLATIAIVAILVISVMVVIPSFLNWATKTRNQHSLLLLNQALDIYKGLGGLSKAHSLQGPNSQDKIDAVIAAMKAGVTVGKTKQAFWKDDNGIDATQLYAKGDGKTFYFCGYGISQSGATLASFAGSYQKHAMGRKPSEAARLVAMIDAYAGQNHIGTNQGAAAIAIQINDGPISYTGYQNFDTPEMKAGDVLTIWSCVAVDNPAPQGHFGSFAITANWGIPLVFSSIDLTNCTQITNFYGGPCDGGSVNLTGCTALTQIQTGYRGPLNITGCYALQELGANWIVGLTPSTLDSKYVSLTTVDIRNATIGDFGVDGCPVLQSLLLQSDYINTALIKNCPSLTSIGFSPIMKSVLVNNCPALNYVESTGYAHGLMDSGWNAFFNSLPTVTPGTANIRQWYVYETGDHSIATAKGWTFPPQN